MATGVQVVFDCADPRRLAIFWASALGYSRQPPPEGFDSWERWAEEQKIPEDEWGSMDAVVDPAGTGPRLFFHRVPEPKTTKNRVHLDVNVGGGMGTPLEERRVRVDAEADRLTGEGATVLRPLEERGEYFVVMADPEGNEFCLQ